MRFLAAVDAWLGAFGSDESRALREAARADFEERTGAFSPDDPWFEARSAAFIDDALTQMRVVRELSPRVPEEARAWGTALTRCHRGLFEVKDADGEALVIADLISGAELVVTDVDESTAIAFDAARGLFDARAVGFSSPEDPPCIGVLPGPVFHAEESTAAIREVVAAANAAGLSAAETLDALLRMERNYRSLSRVKPGYAYKKEALAKAPKAPPSAPRGVGALRSRLTKRSE